MKIAEYCVSGDTSKKVYKTTCLFLYILVYESMCMFVYFIHNMHINIYTNYLGFKYYSNMQINLTINHEG